jgi:RNA polymerase sigma factor (sigma-70 family)
MTPPAHHEATHGAIEAAWRIEAARIVAALARMTRDVGLAEDLAQDALLAALEHWPRDGVPNNPGAWLMTTAKRRALDRLRHHAMAAREHEALGRDLEAQEALHVPDLVDGLIAKQDDPVGDDLLRLVFTACHPVLSRDAQVALTLRLVAGLSTAEIASAFLAQEATIAQRLVRAKRTLAEARVPFELPGPQVLTERLAAVLEVVYLVFNEGYAATSGEDWMRPALCDEALRLGRMLAALVPADAEVHGLLALMELQASRTHARVDAAGVPVLLADQDRGRWDRLLIRRGLAGLARAQALAGDGLGPYALQAAIAACHARAARPAETEWPRIVALYDALHERAPSPVVALNRAVAVGQAEGADAALPLVEALVADAALARYHLLHAVHGDLLHKTGRRDAARAAFERAAELAGNERERELMQRRAADLS